MCFGNAKVTSLTEVKKDFYQLFFLAFNTMHLNLNNAGEPGTLDTSVIVLSCLSIALFVVKVTLITPCFPSATGSEGF